MKCEIGARSSQATILVIGRNPSDSRLLTNYLGKTKHEARILTDSFNIARRLFRKAVQEGRSKRRGEAYSLSYVEPLSAARTPLADFINSLKSGPQR